MRGKNEITQISNRRLQMLVAGQVFWIGLVSVLGAWWGKLALRQAAKIAELQVAAGQAADLARQEWMRTRHMLFWESSIYFTLVVVITSFLFRLYWRDLRRSRSVQAFFASVTHELRTPLTSIRLQAESIADNLSNDPVQRPLLDRLLEDTLRLEGQVERTLELARVEGGGPVFVQPIQLKPWLDRMLQSWKAAYGGRMELRAEAEDVAVQADPAALQVILKNLLENSLKHARKDRVAITLRTRPRGACVVLSVQDDGGGYSGDAGRLGELFYRGSSSQGTGVGLYLVRVLMKRMGGEARFVCNGGFEGGAGFMAELEFVRKAEGSPG